MAIKLKRAIHNDNLLRFNSEFQLIVLVKMLYCVLDSQHQTQLIAI